MPMAKAQTPSLLTNITQITASSGHTCALTSNGIVKCWGYNFYGQLGDGTKTTQYIPALVSGLSGIKAIAAGYAHTCALTASGGIKCWGSNEFGQLGDGTIIDSLISVSVSSLTSGITAIAAGDGHTCAITSSGGIKCWGSNESGQLGNGTTTDSAVPVDVNGLSSGVTAIALGGSHTCALTATGGVKCWGSNYAGWLGDGTAIERHTPVNVSGLSNGVIAIATGDSHSCALTASGGVKCWGYNSTGQLGNGNTTKQYIPIDVSGLTSDITTIAAGYAHSCALTSNGGVKCWGGNTLGELGDGTGVTSDVPVQVSDLSSGIIDIALGKSHTCAMTNSKGVKCWGSNEVGQLGYGATIGFAVTPVDVTDSTPTATATPMPTVTPTLTLTAMLMPNVTPTLTATLMPNVTPTFTPTATATLMPNVTPTFTPTLTATLMPNVTPTFTPTATLMPNVTPSPTLITQKIVYLPIIIKSEPTPTPTPTPQSMTTLYIQSNHTGGINLLEVYGPNKELLLSCVIGNNTTQECGKFKTVNPYTIKADTAYCGKKEITFNDAVPNGTITEIIECAPVKLSIQTIKTGEVSSVEVRKPSNNELLLQCGPLPDGKTSYCGEFDPVGTYLIRYKTSRCGIQESTFYDGLPGAIPTHGVFCD